MVNLSLEDSSSNGIDIDFSNGSLSNVQIIGCGNDGIDISGSVVQMSNVDRQNISDKAVSVGEKSILTAEQLNVVNAKICLAVKDSSSLELYESNCARIDIGLAVFQKKKEYGPSTANVWRLVSVQNDDLYRLEAPSRLMIDGKTMTTNSSGLVQLLYPDITL